MCSVCGCVHRENRPSQALFHCVDCGHEMNADVNAARNILRRAVGRGLELPPEIIQGQFWRTVEVN